MLLALPSMNLLRLVQRLPRVWLELLQLKNNAIESAAVVKQCSGSDRLRTKLQGYFDCNINISLQFLPRLRFLTRHAFTHEAHTRYH